eukprot:1373352-Amorphochlora_amoeboformis.AAC.2
MASVEGYGLTISWGVAGAEGGIVRCVGGALVLVGELEYDQNRGVGANLEVAGWQRTQIENIGGIT